MPKCYLCGKSASKPLTLKKTFTAHSSARVPTSDKMCDRCYSTMDGDQKELWYWNEGKNKWSKLWGRSLSRLYQGESLICPLVEGTHTEGQHTFPIVSGLATRAQMRDWLVNPPEPPFTIVIAESGQKHVLFLAQEAQSLDVFPVQFELDSLHINLAKFTQSLQTYESLMALEFSKTEIDSGNYHSDRLMKCLEKWEPLESEISMLRGTRLLQLISYVAKKDAD
ncbi:MAG: hypothetical protein ACRCZS_28910 [Chroococcidiopsis sp.]